MKKIVLLTLSLALIAQNAFSEIRYFPFRGGATFYGNSESSDISYLQGVGGLTFYCDYSKNDVTADFSLGSGVGTVAAARSSTNPATYITDDGIIKTLETANVGRFTAGYYDSEGFHQRPGIMVELAGTNLLLHSADFSQTEWTASNITVSTNTTTSPDGGLNADTLTATNANATILQAQTIASAQKSFSIFLKRKTGSGAVDITVDGGTTWVTVALSANRWKRFSVTQTVTNPSCGVRIQTSGDEVYAWGAQNEAMNFTTSYIPTSAAAVTRVKETLSYAIASNRTANNETMFFTTTPFWSGTQIASLSGNLRLTSTSTKKRLVNVSTSDKIIFSPNNTDSSGVTATQTTIPTAYEEYALAFTCDADNNPGTTAATYLDGTSEATSTTNFTSPVWGTSFYVGSDSDTLLQWSGIITKVAFFNSQLSATTVAAVSEKLLGPQESPNTYYVDATLGKNSNDGLTVEEPWQTIAKVNATVLANGQTVLFKRGEVWRESLVVPQTATAALPNTYGNYGTASTPPTFNGADVVTGWTNTSGTTWQAAFTTDTFFVAFDGVKGTRVGSVGAINDPYEYFWDTNVLYVYSTSDPDSAFTQIEAAVREESIEINGKSHNVIDGIKCIYNNDNGISLLNTCDNITVKNCIVQYNANDGINGHNALTNTTIEYNTVEYNGQGRGLGTGAGDGISFHENSDSVIQNNTVRFNDKAGIDNVDTSTSIVRYNYLEGNDINITLGGVGDNAQTGATMNVYYNIVVVASNDSIGIELSGTVANSPVLNAYNNVVYGAGAGTGIAQSVAGTLTAKNNIVMGCSKGLDLNAGTLTETNNDVYLNTTNFEGLTADATTFTANPQLVNPTSGDFRIERTSPCVNTGTDVSLTRDYFGNPIVGNPDVGIYEIR